MTVLIVNLIAFLDWIYLILIVALLGLVSQLGVSSVNVLFVIDSELSEA